MTTCEMPDNETQRIEALKKYNILDTPADGSFDRITSLASAIFQVPVAIVSLVDTDRIWFKSHHGLSVSQLNRDPGLCASAILSDDIYIIENAKDDPRSLANPLVAGEFGLGFYAAVPLQTEENYNLGTLCIIDKAPRTFSDEDKEILKRLGELVMHEMEMRLSIRDTVATIKNLSSDMTSHLQSAIKSIEATSGEDAKGKMLSYLEASRMFLSNMNNHLNQLN